MIPLTKIFKTPQIRELDSQSIRNQRIRSIDLMERAASEAFKRIISYASSYDTPFLVIAGMGNNGGDGLAIARMLFEKGYSVSVIQIAHSSTFSEDCQTNKKRLHDKIPYTFIQEEKQLDELLNNLRNSIIIDALLGSGLSRPIEKDTLLGKTILKINTLRNYNLVISIDIASGLSADMNFSTSIAIQPHYTLSFELPKLAFLFPENEAFVGKWEIVPIQLSQEVIQELPTSYFYFTQESANFWKVSRPKFSHKGTYGHVLIWGGSYGKIGATVLAARAALHSGAGLVTVYVPKCGYEIVQTSVPQSMCLVDENNYFLTDIPEIEYFDAIVAGMGMDTQEISALALKKLLMSRPKNLVLDADALNLIAKHQFHTLLPTNSVLTPHLKEFERLFGKTHSDKERLEVLMHQAIQLNVRIVLKGAHTAVAYPDGRVIFNSTGSPAMATAGSGDVLSGIIGAKLADKRFQDVPENVSFAVFLHGLAGQKSASKYGEDYVTALQIIKGLSNL
ncbi:MAG: NAD(P)H-hydrate dehydratase [Cytophagales bacterium]|nr:NAD(P)H-hydrate dehydratase [Cytophagales bacterium]MDW8384852.1 NAD(P)H-hydrate dehydratase [Flammeovirgaceae bacterium]